MEKGSRFKRFHKWFEVVWRVFMGSLSLLMSIGLFYLLVFAPPMKITEPLTFPLFVLGTTLLLIWSVSLGIWFIVSLFARLERAEHVCAVIAFSTICFICLCVVKVGDDMPRMISAVPNLVPGTFGAIISLLQCFRRFRRQVGYMDPVFK